MLTLVKYVVVVRWCVRYMSKLSMPDNTDPRNVMGGSLFVALVRTPIEAKTANTQMHKVVRAHNYWRQTSPGSNHVYANSNILMKPRRAWLCMTLIHRAKNPQQIMACS
jgi:hypothetical protein